MTLNQLLTTAPQSHSQLATATAVSSESVAKPCRVLHIIDSLGVGGAETWIMSLLRYFAKHRIHDGQSFEFDLCLTSGKEAVFDDEARALGATLHYLPYSRRNLWSFTTKFRKLLRNRCYSAIHDHQEFSGGFHLACGLGALPPVRVIHVHNPLLHYENYGTTFSRRCSIKMGRAGVALFSTAIAGTSCQLLREYRYDRQPFVSRNRGAAHCGFDVNEFMGDYEESHRSVCREFGWPSSVRIVLFVGRLDSNRNEQKNQKNPAFAFKIAQKIAQRNRDTVFLFAGAGDEARSRFETEVREASLEDQIRFVKPRNDIHRLMIGSDQLLFPSHAEGLGMVVVEAQAAGLPVLASDTTPREAVVLPELVEHLPLEFGVSRWAEVLEERLRAPRPSIETCNRAVHRSAFSIESSAKRLIHLYLENK